MRGVGVATEHHSGKGAHHRENVCISLGWLRLQPKRLLLRGEDAGLWLIIVCGALFR